MTRVEEYVSSMTRSKHADAHEKDGPDELVIRHIQRHPVDDTTPSTGEAYVWDGNSFAPTGIATQAELDAHTGDTVDAHDASAISFSPTGNIAATDAQAAIAEVDSETDARLDALGVWQDYTPVLTASTTSPTLGAGSTQSGRYVQIGKLVTGWAYVEFGDSGVDAGSGNYFVSLPVEARDNGISTADLATNTPPLGSGRARDVSGTAGERFYIYIVPAASGGSFTTARLFQASADSHAAVTNASPWAWAATDYFMVDFTYEAA